MATITVEDETRLVRSGNSTAVVLSREVLRAAGLDRGDRVVVAVEADAKGTVIIRAADDGHSRALAAGRALMDRYPHTFAKLAK